MTDKEQEKKERLKQIKEGTYINRPEVVKAVEIQKGVKPNV